MSDKIRVLIADDSPDIVDLYERLIDGECDLECVQSLSSAHELEQAVERLCPHVAVIDLTMPGPDPLQIISALAPKYAGCRFLAFSGYDDQGTKDLAFGAGCCGLISKHDHPMKLIEEIRRVAARSSAG